MRFEFKKYIPKNYNVLKHRELSEDLFPDRRTFLEYKIWKYDNLKQYNSKEVEKERERMKDHEYIVEMQCKRGIKEIKNKIVDYDERIGLILGKDNFD